MQDFIAIGDTVVDAFIRLKNAEELVHHGALELCLPFAEKVPYENVYVIPAVGNAANASVAAARLDLSSSLVTNIGSDQNGKDCLATLKGEKVDTQFVKVNDGAKTNYHYVLWFHVDRTILVRHEPYQYKLPNLREAKWVYLSSLADNALDYHLEIIEYLKTNPKVQLAFQPGTFQIKLGFKAIKDIYARTKILFCNIEEAERILGMNTLGTEELLKRVKALGPEIVVITDGPKGAYAFDGTNMWHQLPYPDPKLPLERTGAGDAFASTTVSALALSKDLPTALSWGAINSMSVVQEVGAQKGLLSRKEIEEYLKNAPESFQTKKLN